MMAPLKKFSHHHTALEQIARRKYLANSLEEDGTILIKTMDL
jgi:hypothetical protein